MTENTPPRITLPETLKLLAPGTPLRDGLDRIVRGRTGALIVIGDDELVAAICDGGFEFDVPMLPTKLRELSKMDGAVILSSDGSRIHRANVQLMPDAGYHTDESGTRHRSAERTALMTGHPVIAVSQSMNIITVYVDSQRHVLQEPAEILNRANQAIATLERYRERLDQVNDRLFDAELHNYATVADVVTVLQREIMLLEVSRSIDRDVLELGVDGKQLSIQLAELRGDSDRELDLLIRDYLVAPGLPSDEDVSAVFAQIAALSEAELLKSTNLSQILRLPTTEESLTQGIQPRGYRVLARVPRVQVFLMDKIISALGGVRELLAAGEEELADVDNVGALWARHIHEGLARLRS
ncbi:DNA integrity scanning diadenylate cyclase DisA [Corynebacterium halotolerans]|uniref:DNA integrity scanning diadenylate cyclase DisA n=1 Tax=Corynebacterium halotolerans TaxID=225326 RepID=UPI003CFAF471